MGEYARLEEDIRDINKKNNELKKKFSQEASFTIHKSIKLPIQIETPILIPSKKSNQSASFITVQTNFLL